LPLFFGFKDSAAAGYCRNRHSLAGFAAKAANVSRAGIPAFSLVFAHFRVQAREIPF
jgi:hypothetical protein